MLMQLVQLLSGSQESKNLIILLKVIKIYLVQTGTDVKLLHSMKDVGLKRPSKCTSYQRARQFNYVLYISGTTGERVECNFFL